MRLRRTLLLISVTVAIGVLLLGLVFILREPKQPDYPEKEAIGTETLGAEIIAPISLQRVEREMDKTVEKLQEESVAETSTEVIEEMESTASEDEESIKEREEIIAPATPPRESILQETLEIPKTPEATVAPVPSAVPEQVPARSETPEKPPIPVTTPEPAQHEHTFEKVYWYGAPSCGTANNYYNLICVSCGANGGDGEDSVSHTPNSVSYESADGCRVYRIVESVCEICEFDLGREETFLREEHDWTTGTSDPVWSEEQQDFVSREITYCGKCFQVK